MPKRTTILIIILLLMTISLILLAMRNEKLLKVQEVEVVPTVIPTIMPSTSLSFSKNIIDLSTSKSASQSVDILIDTKEIPVSGVQIELAFDPRIISDIEIRKVNNPFFGNNANVTISSIDSLQGRISYAVSFPNRDQEKKGKGSVINLKFKVNKNRGGLNTSITFLPKSTVTSLKISSSVLENTTPLTLILNSSPSAR